MSRPFIEEQVTANATRVGNGPLGSFERDSFYKWCCFNQVYKRGPALIFSLDQSQLVKDFDIALKHLEFSPLWRNLSETEAALKNSMYILISLYSD